MEMSLRKSNIVLLFLALAFCANLKAEASSALSVPPINTPETSHKYPGKIIWHDLATADVKAAQQFYWKMFGWRFKRYGSGNNTYISIYYKGRLVGGVVALAPKEATENDNQWVSYLSVSDVAQATQYVKNNGGKVLVEPMNFEQQGELAVFTDPEGALFGVLNSSSGDPADGHSRFGEWAWADLLVKNPQRAIKFYQGIADYAAKQYPGDSKSNDYYLYTNNVARAGVAGIPAGKQAPKILPNWLPYILVPDVNAMVTKTPKLGGEVLLKPDTQIFSGKLAVIADPTGAALGLIQVTQTAKN